MRNKATLPNIDLTDPNFLLGRIKNNTGANDGTPVNEFVYGDIHQFFAKLLNLAGLVPNGFPDNEANGYQTIDALISIASKNDYVYELSSVSSVLQVGVKIGLMKTNEFLICKSIVNLGSETTIKGSDNVTITTVSTSNFKSGDYVMFTKTASNIRIDRLIDAVNLDIVVSEYNYLKKATQTQENAGTSELVATTPKTNKTVFERRVNGVDSATYLATALQNGIYPKEHFAIINEFLKVKNRGYLSGYSTGVGPGITLPTGGDITLAVTQASSEAENSIILCTMANAMDNLNYKVSVDVESQGSILSDNDGGIIVFKPISTTQFQLSNWKGSSNPQSLKLHMEVKQL